MLRPHVLDHAFACTLPSAMSGPRRNARSVNNYKLLINRRQRLLGVTPLCNHYMISLCSCRNHLLRCSTYAIHYRGRLNRRAKNRWHMAMDYLRERSGAGIGLCKNRWRQKWMTLNCFLDLLDRAEKVSKSSEKMQDFSPNLAVKRKNA